MMGCSYSSLYSTTHADKKLVKEAQVSRGADEDVLQKSKHSLSISVCFHTCLLMEKQLTVVVVVFVP